MWIDMEIRTELEFCYKLHCAHKNSICIEHEECLVEKATAEKAANPRRCRERRERVWPGPTNKLAHGVVESVGRWKIKT